MLNLANHVLYVDRCFGNEIDYPSVAKEPVDCCVMVRSKDLAKRLDATIQHNLYYGEPRLIFDAITSNSSEYNGMTLKRLDYVIRDVTTALVAEKTDRNRTEFIVKRLVHSAVDLIWNAE